MPTSDTNRRAVIAGLGAAVVASVLPGAASASATTRAQSLVSAISGELAAIIGSGGSQAQIYGAFERLLSRYGDMPAVAASVLGPPWRTASAGQQQAFVGAFQGYLARKYGRQFNEFRDARIDVTGARDAGRAGVLVNTRVLRPGQETIAVDWQISERSGQPRAVNLIIEGVSMLANERAEIGAMLEAQGGNVDGLIRQLQARA